MHAEIEGPDGAPDLVCLHGGIGTGRYHWSRQVDRLAERFRVHLPDLPGHGRTPLADDEPYTRELLAASVEEYLKSLSGPAHVAAFSMGGHTALHLAARRPDLFASLTLVGVAIRDHEGLGGWRERFDPDRLESEFPLWARALSKLHAPQGGPDAWRDVCRRDSAGDLDVEADLDALSALRCPVLLMRGDRDPVVDPAQYGELRELWSQADEFVVPAGGHDVQLTRHQLVAPALGDFLARATDDASG
jgi:3-oxoadipate enol-lactonase